MDNPIKFDFKSGSNYIDLGAGFLLYYNRDKPEDNQLINQLISKKMNNNT